ncbi:PREDICTED: mevalonate kinase-like [Acropora digitifera]|uniref:mevalonate kinase-like n=1 Tax=Acropora digitifera TaxID=70779 RepID=UPI00077AC966|nr:PREDICTED: mevalonate kinase-like [Acropora digitifera]
MSFRAVKATAPGKIILHGEHAVVYGKKAVATSIGLRTTVTLEPQANDCVTLSLLNFNASCQWKQDELQEDVRRLLDADLSYCTQQGSHLFAKFVDQCTVADVKSNLIKDAVSVFVFLLGKIILIDTKVARSTKNLISGLRERYQQFPTIYSPLFDAIGAITEESCVCLEKLYRAEAGAKETMTTDSDDLYRSLAKLIDLNQKLLVTLGVSHNSLDKLCSVTAKYGMHSKLTGAGGGGCAFTLVTPGRVYVERDRRAIWRVFSFVKCASLNTIELSPGICEKSLDDVTGELANQGFEVWDTCLGDPGVTLMIA